MEDKNTDSQPPQRPPDRKTTPGGGNMVWVLLAIGIGTLLLVSLFGADAGEEIVYGDLRRLIEQGKNPEAAIEVPGPDKKTTVRYSNLDKLILKPPRSAAGSPSNW